MFNKMIGDSKKFKVFVIIIGIFIIQLASNSANNNTIDSKVLKTPIETEIKLVKIELQSNRDSIINQILFFISEKIEQHELCIEMLFDICESYEIDVRLPMAQGWIESHYGKLGMAKRTNSIFNVGAFDGKVLDSIDGRFKYETVNCSIEPYAKLISETYLYNQKTERDLLRNFINYKGKRYATAEDYESKLRAVWKEIDSKTNLDSLLNERSKLKYYYTNLIEDREKEVFDVI